MDILREIFDFSVSRPDWESDAIRRLFEKQTLESEDIEELYALLKANNDIPDPKRRKAKRFSADQVPVPEEPDTHVELLAIKDLEHVNALAEEAHLPFAPKGLSVIYGGNASGKSGYSRVLKRACRARDQDELILPNARLPDEQREKPKASFEITVNGKLETVFWVDSGVPPEKLSSIAIFDHRCARAYIDSEGDYAFPPYGLDILVELVKVCDLLKVMVEDERTKCEPDLTPFEGLHGDTDVGKLIGSLTADTDSKEVEKLSTLTEDEKKRHEELIKILHERSPKDRASELRTKSKRIVSIADNAVEKSASVNEVELNRFKELSQSCRIAQQTADSAAGKFKDGEKLLPGTVETEAWKGLFEAAREFSKEAYPDKTFPHTEEGAQCLLCQQLLDEGATRLKNFEEHIRQDAEQTLRVRSEEFSDAKQSFFALDINIGLNDATFDEIAKSNNTLAQECRAFEKALVERHARMKTAFGSNDWDAVSITTEKKTTETKETTEESEEKPGMPANPAEKLQAWAGRLIKQAEDLEKAGNEEELLALQREFNELEARAGLSKLKGAVLSAIEKLILNDRLDKCLSEVNTKHISNETKRIGEKEITEQLKEQLNAEFERLGVGHLRVVPDSRVGKAKNLHKLKLDIPHTHPPNKILSEGEQRAIAIGAFLAEVNIHGGSGGIILDDPVSSLDHRHRERVAERLAKEAAKRQVIIFTHDIKFLCILMDKTEEAGVECVPQSLSRRSSGHTQRFGVPSPDLPFEVTTTKLRIGLLRKLHQEIEKLCRDGNESKHREQTKRAYDLLYKAWERAIEEVLFQKVVQRFSDKISPLKLKGVEVTKDDRATVFSHMKKCNEFRHDSSLHADADVPRPEVLLKDIVALDNWRKNVNERSERVAKE